MVSLFAELVDLMGQMDDLSDPFQDTIFKLVVFSDICSCNWGIPIKTNNFCLFYVVLSANETKKSKWSVYLPS